ncbi:MAG: hypothetical protein ACI86L_002047 [Dokdonia sp.]|jgi:hypothetical protein
MSLSTGFEKPTRRSAHARISPMYCKECVVFAANAIEIW